MTTAHDVGRSIAALGGVLLIASAGPARGPRAPSADLDVHAAELVRHQDPDQRYLLGVRGLDLLAVDFMAVAEDGSPITDLRSDEVTLRIGGRPRSIRSMQLITVADPWLAGDEAAAALPPPFATNAASDTGRTAIIVLEDASLRTGREGPLREAIDRFLTSLAPRDRVVLVTMPYGGVKVDLTTEHDRVRAAFSQLVGRAPPDETGSDLACRSRRTLDALAGLLSGLNTGDEPIVVLFVTSGLAAPRHDAPVTLAPGACELTTDHFAQVGAAAGAARARVYVIQPEDPTLGPGAIQAENIAGVGFKGSDNPLAGIENLAGVTGAHRLHLASGAGVLERVTRETAAYYRLGFESARSDRDGRSHQLEVRLTREGASVRSSAEVTFARAGARPAPDTPQQMLAVSTVFRDLPLRAAAFASEPSPDGTLKVVSLVEPVDPAATLASVAVGLIDAKGRLVVQWTATAGDLARTPVLAAMTAPPGTYRVRAAAVDASGLKGTADDQVALELTPAGDLKLSSLVLGLSRGGGFVPKLQFADEPVAVAYLELYGGAPGAPVSALLELATTPNGPAPLAVPLAIAPTDTPNRYRATGALPIGQLPDGDFIVRAIVGIEGQPAGRVVRTLRKIVR